ncbi:hypothetical protein [Oceanimonas baumannii]|uniref:Type II secretion system protein GspC N-terminal domain-containing protein n=1 Tax=Oceanimonas baumannii TaxID=129578 RepID=A0A235CM48_9GAMM|nr:hypothetical protein [Oceanimonas baumannii]OYD25668.1 hypothetical protein B6S09_02140 [Oceanimonas baumannii]TDW56984.1 hypothetical protein LY04_02789 [Oceanimonas baumannii]
MSFLKPLDIKLIAGFVVFAVLSTVATSLSISSDAEEDAASGNNFRFSLNEYEPLPELAPGNLFVSGRSRNDQDKKAEKQEAAEEAVSGEPVLTTIITRGSEKYAVFLIGKTKKMVQVGDSLDEVAKVVAINDYTVTISTPDGTSDFVIFPSSSDKLNQVSTDA